MAARWSRWPGRAPTQIGSTNLHDPGRVGHGYVPQLSKKKIEESYVPQLSKNEGEVNIFIYLYEYCYAQLNHRRLMFMRNLQKRVDLGWSSTPKDRTHK
jgi:hypothetical protein